MLWIGRSSHSPMLLCACVCVSLCVESVTSFRLFVCWNMYPFVQNNAGKKNCFTRNCRLDSEDWHSGGPICSESVVFSLSCVALCVRASPSLSVWCMWAFDFVVTLFDVVTLSGAWDSFCCEVHYIRAKFLEALELRFSWFWLLSCIFLVSIDEESPRDKTYWTSTDTGVYHCMAPAWSSSESPFWAPAA